MTGPKGNSEFCFPETIEVSLFRITPKICSVITRSWHERMMIYMQQLARWTPDRAVWVRTLAEDTVLSSYSTLDTSLSWCLSPPRCIDEYQRTERIPYIGLASHSVESRNTPTRFMLQKTG